MARDENADENASDAGLLTSSSVSDSKGAERTLSSKPPTMKENVVTLLQIANEQLEQNKAFFKRLEDNEANTKSTSDLVKFGFIVIIATTAATVVGAIAVLVTTMISLYSLWTSDQNDKRTEPVNSCAIIESKD